MKLPASYNPSDIEARIYKMWEDGGFFHADATSGKPAFTIPMPPPNANGRLHLGHVSMLSYEDIMIRYHRMKGDEALWIPGTDHAGIQTQVVFERHLKQTQGKTRDDLGRDEFYRQLFDFCMTNKSVITGQIRLMGASCDWSREKFTLDADLVAQVQQTFVDMYHDGTVYRGYRITNWCPACRTTLANIEVEHKDMPATLYFIKYTDELTVATVRPETKLADTGVAVHPDDSRYAALVGKTLDISLAGHQIRVKVFADQAVDREFGTGAIGVTPAHSEVDYKFAQAHDLEIVPVIEMDGTLNDQAGAYAGMTVAAGREAFIKDLRASGQLIKEESYVAPIAVCERSGTPIEPLLSHQWFINVAQMRQQAIEVVNAVGEGAGSTAGGDNAVTILPERFKKQYIHWMENLEDWNISRQIWWGPEIPAWYCDAPGCGEIIVQIDTPTRCPRCNGTQLRKDADTFDTWFSSGQWPVTILGGEGAPDFERFYPTSVLETGWDILFFWVTRMIMLGLYRTGKSPFHTVYLHGLILDKDGHKMSKSKGNGIDPLEMISQYSADALRLALVVGAKPGQNMRLYPEKIAGFHATMNKLWNIARFILNNERPTDLKLDQATMTLADRWILSRLQRVTQESTRLIEDYQFGEAARMLLAFTREEFADWFIEVAKIEKSENAQKLLYIVLRRVLRLLHPFIPFITEEIWGFVGEASDSGTGGEKLIRAAWPKADAGCMDENAEKLFAMVQEIISALRNIRAEQQIAPDKSIRVIVNVGAESDRALVSSSEALISALAKVETLELPVEPHVASKDEVVVAVKDMQVIVSLAGLIDVEKELATLREEREHVQAFIAALEKKLSNTNFVQHAPSDVVAREQEKLADQRAKLASIEAQIENLAHAHE